MYKAEKVTDNLYDLCVYDTTTNLELRHPKTGATIFIPVRKGDDPEKVVDTYVRSYSGYAEHAAGFKSLIPLIKFD